MMRKQIITVMDKIITKSEEEINGVTPSLITEYRELNEKCDGVIAKIRNRKEKTSKTNEVK